MILCLCRGVSECEVRDAVLDGARTLKDVARRCRGAGGDCGSCRPRIAQQLADADQALRAASPPPWRGPEPVPARS